MKVYRKNGKVYIETIEGKIKWTFLHLAKLDGPLPDTWSKEEGILYYDNKEKHEQYEKEEKEEEERRIGRGSSNI